MNSFYSIKIVIPILSVIIIFGCYTKNTKQNLYQEEELAEHYRIALFSLHTLTENVVGVKDEMEDKLTAYFLRSNLFLVLERKMIDKIIEELKLQVSDLMDVSTSIKIGRLIGAQYIIVGSISSFKNKLILSIRILDVETGKIMSISTGKDRFSKIGKLVNQCSEELIENFVISLSKK